MEHQPARYHAPTDESRQGELNPTEPNQDAWDDVLRPRSDHRDIPLRARAGTVIRRLQSSETHRDPDSITTFQVVSRLAGHGPPDAHDDIDAIREHPTVWAIVRDVLKRTDCYGGEYPDHVTIPPGAHEWAALDAVETAAREREREHEAEADPEGNE